MKLSPVLEAAEDDGATSIALDRLNGLDMREADDGWHGIWRVDGVSHQFWLAEPMPETVDFYEVRLRMDTFLELRAHAARRLWRSLNGRRPGADFRRMPDQLRRLHIQSRRALDARQRGESFRTIAEILLGFRGTREEWLDDPRRNRSRRLAAHGLAMMQGGYRLLLHYPVKIGRR